VIDDEDPQGLLVAAILVAAVGLLLWAPMP